MFFIGDLVLCKVQEYSVFQGFLLYSGDRIICLVFLFLLVVVRSFEVFKILLEILQV